MKLQYLWMPLLAISTTLVCGCNSIPVEAVAPGPSETQEATTTLGGQYVLYKATGFDHAPAPVIERLWAVTAPSGAKVGFRWATDRSHLYDAFGANHLEAYINGNVRDLGTFDDHDVKYVWAGVDTDLTSYFRQQREQKDLQTMSLN